ncbi:MAG: hypothetical protein AAF495_04615 [Pseudomonadota bacterium]
MIKSIALDLGGVLFTEGKGVALAALSRDHGYDPAIVRKLLTCARSLDLRKGLLTEVAFWSWAEGQIPQGYSALVIRDAWYAAYTLDRDVLQLVEGLKGRFRLVAYSENIPDRIAYLEAKYRFRALFDMEVYSYDHHLGKGDPAFLEVLLTTLGDRPEEILYIDDTKVFLDLAEQRGLKVLHYTTGRLKQIEPELRRLGVLA